MAGAKPKGSIVYEILIVLLIAGLLGTILYPKSIWNQEEKKTELCRERMTHILRAELQYISEYNTYTDSLPELVNFILGDTTLERLRNYIEIDSVLAAGIVEDISEHADKAEIVAALKAAVDSMETDTVLVGYLSLEKLVQRVPELPLETIIGEWETVPDTVSVDTLRLPISLKHVLEVGPDLVQNKEIIRTLWFIAIEMEDFDRPHMWVLNLLEHNPAFISHGDSLAVETVQSFSACPTVGDTMRVTVIDTAVFKEIIIECPIDSLDSVMVARDLLRSKIGGLSIQNHGRIENGEVSWKEE